jgi:hypothetical protein
MISDEMMSSLRILSTLAKGDNAVFCAGEKKAKMYGGLVLEGITGKGLNWLGGWERSI